MRWHCVILAAKSGWFCGRGSLKTVIQRNGNDKQRLKVKFLEYNVYYKVQTAYQNLHAWPKIKQK